MTVLIRAFTDQDKHGELQRTPCSKEKYSGDQITGGIKMGL